MSTAGDEAQSVEMELEERTDETEGQIDGDDSNPLEDEYCRAHWNSKSFPTDRGDIIRELRYDPFTPPSIYRMRIKP